MFVVFVLQLFFSSVWAESYEDVFVSVDSMRQIIDVERHMVSQMQQLQANLSVAQRLIDNYLIEFQKLPHHLDPEQLAKDPLFTFQLMRRFGMNLNPIFSEVLNIPLPVTESRLILPDYNGVVVSATHLVQLHGLYKLPMDELIEGRIKHYPSYTKLKAEDVIILAKSINYSYFSVDKSNWTKTAYDMTWKDLKNDRIWMPLKLYYLQELLNQDEEIERSEEEEESKIPDEETSQAKNADLTDDKKTEKSEEKVNASTADPQFNRLCRGEQLRTPQEEAALSCVLTTRNQPYYILMPAKMEIISLKPKIFIFHELLTLKEVERIQNLSRNRLYRSTVKAENPFSKGRSSKTAWMKEKDDPVFVKMTRQVQLLTGLNVIENKTAEQFQVVNYGLGGQYYHHYDVSVDTMEEVDKMMNDTKHTGGRLVTFMYYLSSVEEGGFTVFSKARVFSKPIQGSAIYWHNRFPTGLTDKLTFHGGCPVLYGSKWISNKWIHYKDQMKTKVCGTNQTKWLFY